MQNLFIKGMEIIFSILFFLIAFSVFSKNELHTVEQHFFDNFQRDSEALVVGGIVAEDLKLDKKNWNLGHIKKNGLTSDGKKFFSEELFSNKEDSAGAVFKPYVSQVGVQEIFYSKLQHVFKFKSISNIQNIPAGILAFLIVAFIHLNRRVYGIKYALIFSVTLVLSPWVAVFARQLYWSEFLWLLPCFFATAAYIAKSAKYRRLFYFLTFASFFVKSMSGYEYITSITLLACSPFVVGPFFIGERPKWKSAAIVFILCVAGFFSAFVIHADMRGDTVLDGAADIYTWDIKRRTYSAGHVNYKPYVNESLRSNPADVVSVYITRWLTPIIPGVPGYHFKRLIGLAAFFLFLRWFKKDRSAIRDFALLLYTSLIPISWFFLAKGHSYVHTHMNYVLWYLGFIPALFFVLINSAGWALARIINCSFREKLYLSLGCLVFFLAVYQFANKLYHYQLTSLLPKELRVFPELGLTLLRSQKTGDLILSVNNCSRAASTRFFLHGYRDGGNLVGNYDFDWKDKEAYVFRDARFRAENCVALVDLGNAPIAKIHIGQFDEQGRQWEREINLDENDELFNTD